jgi:hypothetical protein
MVPHFTIHNAELSIVIKKMKSKGHCDIQDAFESVVIVFMLKGAF